MPIFQRYIRRCQAQWEPSKSPSLSLISVHLSTVQCKEGEGQLLTDKSGRLGFHGSRGTPCGVLQGVERVGLDIRVLVLVLEGGLALLDDLLVYFFTIFVVVDEHVGVEVTLGGRPAELYRLGVDADVLHGNVLRRRRRVGRRVS